MTEKTTAKVPQIRFKGFEGEWEQTRLEELIRLNSGRDYKHLYPGNIPVYGTGGYMLSVNEALSTSMDAVGIGRKGTIDKPFILKAPFWTVDTLFYATPLENNDLNFIYGVFQRIDWKLKDESTGLPSLSKGVINSTQVSKTSPEEQSKIGTYIQDLNNLIRLHQNKHDKLVTLKKAMLQKMFPQPGKAVPEIRFKGFEGEWGEVTLNKIASKVTEKNLAKEHSETFTNSAEFGVISQRDYFDKDISNEENIGNYYIVAPECFVYNPRISVLAPVGPVNRNNLGRFGIMSPLYTVFRTKDIDNTFLEYFFKTNLWHAFMFLNGDTGARADRFSIKDSVFMGLPIPYPTLPEQQKIGAYFRSLDELIAKHATQLKKLQQIKSACLDKMFV